MPIFYSVDYLPSNRELSFYYANKKYFQKPLITQPPWLRVPNQYAWTYVSFKKSIQICGTKALRLRFLHWPRGLVSFDLANQWWLAVCKIIQLNLLHKLPFGGGNYGGSQNSADSLVLEYFCNFRKIQLECVKMVKEAPSFQWRLLVFWRAFVLFKN